MKQDQKKLLVYRLQKRYNDIARCMKITVDLQATSIPLDRSPSVTNIMSTTIDYIPILDDQKSLSMFTDGLIPYHFKELITSNIDYEHLIDMIKLKIKSNENIFIMHGQIDGIVDNDNDEKDRKSFVKKREFFFHSTNNYNYSSKINGQNHYTNELPVSNNLISMSRFNPSNRSLLEERLRRIHNIYNETKVTLKRLNENDIDETIWQRYEQYQTMNRFPSHNRSNTYSTNNNNNNRSYPTTNTSYPRSNYYRDYYTGNNYEDEDGMLLDNEYDDFESNRVYRGTTRGRPRGRAGRGSHHGHPPRGVNHLTTGSFQSNQRLIQPKIESPKLNEQQQQQQQPIRNKRKPVKLKSVTVTTTTTTEEKPKRPGKVLRNGRISRKPRRDSETDFGSDNSDDSGAKDKETGSDDDDEEFDLTQLGLGFGNSSTIVTKGRDGSSSSSSNDSLTVTNLSLTNFAAFAQSQLLATNLANGLLKTNDELSNDSDFSIDGFETDESDDILSQKTKINSGNTDDEDLDDFTYSQTMLSLIKSMQPNHVKIDLDLVPQNKNVNSNKDNDDDDEEPGEIIDDLYEQKQTLFQSFNYEPINENEILWNKKFKRPADDEDIYEPNRPTKSSKVKTPKRPGAQQTNKSLSYPFPKKT
ncbi:unnamed protein product [Rotaria sordida]|uniref:Uncharacterized protein n=1 Tax=Rotaria sordida TaxID=392033 RepID=A0A818NES4_9BILA|nr:unnamed protein product [Rotaria sordida]